MSESGDGASDNGSVAEENDHDMIGCPDAEDSDDAVDEPDVCSVRNEPEPAPEPAPEPPKDQGAKKKNNTLKYMYNKQMYEISKAPLDDKRVPTKPGWCRWHRGHTVAVKDGKKIGEMVESAAGWPKGDALHELVRAETIVCVAGYFDEKKTAKGDSVGVKSDGPDRLSFVWFAILESEEAIMLPGIQDGEIVRKIPQRPFTEILNNLKADESLQKSLLLKQIPDGESNEKNLSPTASGFKLLKGEDVPKSACVMPAKPKKPRGESEGSKKAAKDGGKGKDDGVKGKEDAKDVSGAPSDVRGFFKAKAKPGESAKESPTEPPKAPPKDTGKAAAGEMPRNEAPTKETAAKPVAKPPAKGNGKRAAAQAAGSQAEAVPVCVKLDDDEMPTKQSVSIKRRRTEVVERHDGMFCDDLICNVDFSRPAGATAFEAVITWKFD
jgi:hypothetical protein